MGLGIRPKLQAIGWKLIYLAKSTIFRPRLYDLGTSERFGCIYREPSDMCVTDRLMLFALVRGLRPQKAIEIGARWGNSARIISNAMEDNGCGQIVGIDPVPENFRAKSKELHGRYTLVEGYSPQDIPKALAVLSTEKIDFAFVDGLHTYDAVKKDISGILPHMQEGGHILFHDGYHQGIDQAIKEALIQSDLIDCGLLTRSPDIRSPVCYEGIRLLRKGPSRTKELIADACMNNGVSPDFSEKNWNADAFGSRQPRHQ